MKEMMKKWHNLPTWSRWLIEILLILGILLSLRAYILRDAIEGEAPQIQAVQINGVPFALKQFRGKPSMVYFWATWCPICGLMDASVADIALDHQVMTLAYQSGTAEEVRLHMQAAGFKMPVINDQFGEWAQLYRVRGVPVAFFIDGTGKVRWIETGLSSAWGLRFRLWVLQYV